MVAFLLRYWRQIVLGAVGLLAGVLLARLYYVPVVARLDAAAVELRVSLKAQTDAVAQWEKAAKKARSEASAALARAKAREQSLDALRADLAARKYRLESCDDAAAAVREQWRAR